MTFLKSTALVLALAGLGTAFASAAHADYMHNHHHYAHRSFMKPDHGHPHGYYRYY